MYIYIVLRIFWNSIKLIWHTNNILNYVTSSYVEFTIMRIWETTWFLIKQSYLWYARNSFLQLQNNLRAGNLQMQKVDNAIFLINRCFLGIDNRWKYYKEIFIYKLLHNRYSGYLFFSEYRVLILNIIFFKKCTSANVLIAKSIYQLY